MFSASSLKTSWGPSKLVTILQLQENERKLQRSLQEVKNVEFELEEAASRKKVHEYLFKGAQSRLNGLKSLAKLFKIRCLQSVSIFSILNHPCSIMVYYYLFDVFLCL